MSKEKTPWAVICKSHGIVFLTNTEYERQLSASDSSWKCPICRCEADWDDNNHDAYWGS